MGRGGARRAAAGDDGIRDVTRTATMGRVISYNDGMQRCAFCGKSEREVNRLVAGAGVAICDECVALCVEIIADEQTKDTKLEVMKLPKPAQINAVLDEYVIGQESAKRTLSVAVYNHFKRIEIEKARRARHGGADGDTLLTAAARRIADPDDDVDVAKSNILMLGPTGVGKTYLAQTLAKAMRVPFVIVDATTLTEAGYVGDDVETVLQRLIQTADGDVARASHGIIYIDEIDKIARKSGENTSVTRDVSGEGVQQALLKIIEGTVANVPVEGARKHREAESVQIDTRDILFICGGAFVGLDDIVADRLGRRTSGFGTSWGARQVGRAELLAQVTADDLENFGLLPEFIGRLPVVTALDELGADDLKEILTKPANALTRQYRKLFAVDGVTLTFTDDAIERIARIALERGTGARGLRSIIERTLEDAMDAVPGDDAVSEVIVDAEAVDGTRGPRIVSEGHRPVLRLERSGV